MTESFFEREPPELEKQFGAFANKALEEGALSAKMKELIAAALSVAVKCEPCLEHHLEQAIRKELVAEGPMYAALPSPLFGAAQNR